MTGEPTLTYTPAVGSPVATTIYSTDPEDTEPQIRLAEKDIPYRSGNIFQHLGRKNKIWKYGGIIHPAESAGTIVSNLTSWYEIGAGLATGTLTLVNTANPSGISVFISHFKASRQVGFSGVATFIYILELTEKL